MADETNWYDDVAFPALLRGARATYGSAMRAELEEAGCSDVPRTGSFVLGAIARNGSPLGDIIRRLGLSKQAAGQLVDTLVIRGYLDRVPDSVDRRRTTVSLTERGKAAAAAGRAGVERVDAQLAAKVGAERVSTTRATLGALLNLGHEHADDVDA
jgi:DNA-binding MarR family transcriptional regulator